MQNKVLGLDLGTKTLGVAISDSFGVVALPYGTFNFKRNHFHEAIAYVVDLVKQQHVTVIVLGYPKNMDSSIGKRAKMAQRFKKQLQKVIEIEVVLLDERLTTIQATNALNYQNVSSKDKKKYVDTIAACMILQNYLDSRR